MDAPVTRNGPTINRARRVKRSVLVLFQTLRYPVACSTRPNPSRLPTRPLPDLPRYCYENDPVGIIFIHNGAPQVLVGCQIASESGRRRYGWIQITGHSSASLASALGLDNGDRGRPDDLDQSGQARREVETRNIGSAFPARQAFHRHPPRTCPGVPNARAAPLGQRLLRLFPRRSLFHRLLAAQCVPAIELSFGRVLPGLSSTL